MRSSPSPLSGWDHYQDKARQGHDQDLSEGTVAAGSRGLVGFKPHICADGHETKTLFKTGLWGKINANKHNLWAMKRCKSASSHLNTPIIQANTSKRSHTLALSAYYLPEASLWFGYTASLNPPQSLITILDCTLDLHSYRMSHGKMGGVLL